jgi:ATP-binding cassette, subfamily C, bacterial
VNHFVVAALASVGLPASVGALLMVVVALIIKSALNLFAMSDVGYAVAEVTTDLQLSLLKNLLSARWGYFTQQPVGLTSGLDAVTAASIRTNIASLAGERTVPSHRARSNVDVLRRRGVDCSSQQGRACPAHGCA